MPRVATGSSPSRVSRQTSFTRSPSISRATALIAFGGAVRDGVDAAHGHPQTAGGAADPPCRGSPGHPSHVRGIPRQGFRGHDGSCCEQALKAVQTHRPDLVITDLSCRGSTGSTDRAATPEPGCGHADICLNGSVACLRRAPLAGWLRSDPPEAVHAGHAARSPPSSSRRLPSGGRNRERDRFSSRTISIRGRCWAGSSSWKATAWRAPRTAARARAGWARESCVRHSARPDDR